MSAISDVKRDLQKARIAKEATGDLIKKIEAKKREKDAEGSLYFLSRVIKSVEHTSMEVRG